MADRRVHGTVKEVVGERFQREAPRLHPLPMVRFDTSYVHHRFVHWDGYVDVCGNRYSVPASLCGKQVRVRLSLDGELRIYCQEALVAEHRVQSAREGWVTVPDHHRELWGHALSVERRDLSVYEEACGCS